MSVWSGHGIFIDSVYSPSSLQPDSSADSGGWWLQNWRIGPGTGWDSVLLGVFFDLVKMDVLQLFSNSNSLAVCAVCIIYHSD